jgi:hypothetical protein
MERRDRNQTLDRSRGSGRNQHQHVPGQGWLRWGHVIYYTEHKNEESHSLDIKELGDSNQ